MAGGFVIVHASWQWIFLLNVTVGLVLLPLIYLMTRYWTIVAPMVLCGIGMSFFFAPLAHLTMGAVASREHGMTSGANTAMRELGGVLGVTVLATVFLSNGDITTSRRFVSGLAPALWTGTACLVTAALLMLLIPSSARHRPTSPSPRRRYEQTAHCPNPTSFTTSEHGHGPVVGWLCPG